MRDHGVLADRHEVDAGVVQDARLVWGAVVGLVAVGPGAARQSVEEVVDGPRRGEIAYLTLATPRPDVVRIGSDGRSDLR